MLRVGARRPISRVLSPLARGTTIHLGRSLPSASRDRPGWRRGNAPEPVKVLPSLLGLAPGGVCPAAAVAGSAVRSYRTISPLPPRKGAKPLKGLAVCFCGTVPRVAPAGRYPAPCFRGARTFLPPPRGERQSSGRLARGLDGARLLGSQISRARSAMRCRVSASASPSQQRGR